MSAAPEFFTEEEIALLSRPSVPAVMLAQLNLNEGPMYLHAGTGVFPAHGHDWLGMGKIIAIEGLTDGRGTTAQEVLIKLPNVPKDGLRKVFLSSSEVLDRLITLSTQLTDDRRQPIGRALPIFRGLMKKPKITHSEMSDDGGPQRTITLPCEGFMTNRSSPSYGRCTHSDQQARFPGDMIFSFTYLLKNTYNTWPDY